MEVTGRSSSWSVVRTSEKRSADSLSSTMDSARIPWRMAFWDERAFPFGVTAPVDFAELARDASRPATVVGPRDLAPLAREASIRRVELIIVCAFLSWRHCRHVDGRFMGSEIVSG